MCCFVRTVHAYTALWSALHILQGFISTYSPLLCRCQPSAPPFWDSLSFVPRPTPPPHPNALTDRGSPIRPDTASASSPVQRCAQPSLNSAHLALLLSVAPHTSTAVADAQLQSYGKQPRTPRDHSDSATVPLAATYNDWCALCRQCWHKGALCQRCWRIGALRQRCWYKGCAFAPTVPWPAAVRSPATQPSHGQHSHTSTVLWSLGTFSTDVAPFSFSNGSSGRTLTATLMLSVSSSCAHTSKAGHERTWSCMEAHTETHQVVGVRTGATVHLSRRLTWDARKVCAAAAHSTTCTHVHQVSACSTSKGCVPGLCLTTMQVSARQPTICTQAADY